MPRKAVEHRQDAVGKARHRGHHQLARDLAALPGQPGGKLGELVVGGLRHLRQHLPRLGGSVATGMALKQLHPEACFERVDVADDRGVVHTERLRRTRHRAVTRHLECGAHFVPIVHSASLSRIAALCACEHMKTKLAPPVPSCKGQPRLRRGAERVGSGQEGRQ